MPRCFLLLLAAAFAATNHESALSADPEKNALCTIFMQTNPTSGGFPFTCVADTPYFQFLRPRLSSDKPVTWPWKGQEECHFFQLENSFGSTTIKNLGPGRLAKEGGRFIPTSTSDPKPRGGYLTADYTSDPPAVALSGEPTKYSTWIIRLEIEKEEKSEWTIENAGPDGKHGWLTMGTTSDATIVAGHDGSGVGAAGTWSPTACRLPPIL